ncbi:MAG: helix-turn-helix transcriptional regulator [Clostridia bacterium]|nr:helix-turn-helix transcriptional regulator [Clostridia bacterium]
MAIGERIRFIRNLRGMTQKWLGMAVGFPERAADVRMAQYESGTRTPKENLVNELARVLEVSPSALDIPNIESYIGVMHTLFALEDLYGLKIGCIDDEVCLRLDKTNGSEYLTMLDRFNAWYKEYEKLQNGEISKEDYDQWRYTYPKMEAERSKAELDRLRADKNSADN